MNLTMYLKKLKTGFWGPSHMAMFSGPDKYAVTNATMPIIKKKKIYKIQCVLYNMLTDRLSITGIELGC